MSKTSKKPARRGADASTIRESDLSNRKMGDNKLQGDDQANVRNQRHAVPGQKTDTDDIVEGLEKLDKDVRAKRDLGKGNRGGG